MHNIINIMIWCAVAVPVICFVVAFLDGIWCLVTKRDGLLAWFGYD